MIIQAVLLRDISIVITFLTNLGSVRQTGGMLAPRRLSEIRGALRMSQEGMARLLGVSFATVNRWENGHSSPTGAVMEVYRALDVALHAGKNVRQLLASASLDPGRVYHRIFQLAYGE